MFPFFACRGLKTITLWGFLTALLFASAPLWAEEVQVDPWMQFFKSKDYDQAVQVLEKELAKKEIAEKKRGELLGNLGTVYWAQGKTKTARKYYEKALKVFEASQDPKVRYSVSYINTVLTSANLDKDEGQYDQSEAKLDRLLTWLPEGNVLHAMALDGLGRTYWGQKRYDKSFETLKAAIEVYEQNKTTVATKKLIATRYYELGKLYISRAEYGEAEPYFETAFSYATQSFKPSDDMFQVIFAALQNTRDMNRSEMAQFNAQWHSKYLLAQRAFHNEEIDKAEKLFKEALALAEGIDPQAYATGSTAHALGSVYLSKNKYRAARPYFEQALPIYEEKHGTDAEVVKLLQKVFSALSDDTVVHQLNRKDAYDAVSSDWQALYQKGNALFTKKQYAPAIASLEKSLEIADPPIETGASISMLASVYMEQGNLSKADELYRRGMKIFKDADLGEDPNYGSMLATYGGFLWRMGKYQKAEEHLNQGLSILKKADEASGKQNLQTAHALNNLAFLYTSQGKYRKATELFRQALEIKQKTLDQKHAEVGKALNNLAGAYITENKFAQAKTYLKQAMDVNLQALGPASLELARSHEQLGRIYYLERDYQKSVDHYEQGIAMLKQVFGQGFHPEMGSLMNGLAMSHIELQHSDQAEELLQTIITESERMFGPKHRSTLAAKTNLAVLYGNVGQYDKALTMFQSLLESNIQLLGPEHPELAVTLANIATMYINKGNYEKAKPYSDQAFDIVRKKLSDEHHIYRIADGVRQSIANKLFEQYLHEGLKNEKNGNKEEALVNFKKALQEAEKGAKDSPGVASACAHIGLTYLFMMGEPLKAEPYIRRALPIYEKHLPSNNKNLLELKRALGSIERRYPKK